MAYKCLCSILRNDIFRQVKVNFLNSKKILNFGTHKEGTKLFSNNNNLIQPRDFFKVVFLRMSLE